MEFLSDEIFLHNQIATDQLKQEQQGLLSAFAPDTKRSINTEHIRNRKYSLFKLSPKYLIFSHEKSKIPVLETFRDSY